MPFKVMGVEEEEAEVVEIHGSSDTAILLKLFPRTLHVRRIVDIIDCDNSFGCHSRQKEVYIAHCRFVSMVGVQVCQIEFLARV